MEFIVTQEKNQAMKLRHDPVQCPLEDNSHWERSHGPKLLQNDPFLPDKTTNSGNLMFLTL